MRHMAKAVVAAADEQEGRALLEELRWESTPEAEAVHATQSRIHTQAV